MQELINRKQSRRKYKPSSDDVYMNSFIDLLIRQEKFSAMDTRGLHNFCSIKRINRFEHFYTEESEIQEVAFILKGAVKVSRNTNKICQVTELLTEGEIISVDNIFHPKEISGYAAVCKEDAVLVVFDRNGLQQLITERPAFLNYFIEQQEKAIRLLQNRVRSMQFLSALERFEDFKLYHPEIVKRFNLLDVANYLGMKQETLSRIRNPLMHKAS